MMDSLQPPTKPPRGVKNSKETSGLLMTVIRTLSNSDSNEQREQVRMKLEKDYRESNQLLQDLVSTHHDDLTQVMNLFGQLSNLITNTRQKVRTEKENLIACKRLLTCRRDELKKLWLENIEYKHTLQYLGEIEQMKEVPSLLVNCFSKKDYLQATRSLMTNINSSETTFKDVVGLQELKLELQVKKEELYGKLIDEMKEQIYVHSTQEIIALRRQGSARDSTEYRSPVIHRAEKKITTSNFRSRKMLDIPGNTKDNKIQNNDTVEYLDDLEYIINNLIECVVLLDKIPEFLEELKQSIPRELKNLIMRTTKELSSVDSPNILLEFLQIIMDQFKRIIETHKFILESFKKKYQSNYVYDLKEVWLKIEIVIQQILSEYLDVDNVKKTGQTSTENSNSGSTEQFDINMFFTRKKQQRTMKGSLFKFANSAQNDGSNVNTEQSKVYEEKEKQLLCKPSPSYIMQIFVPLSRFAEEIEQMVNSSQSDQSSKLSSFLNDFVGKVFLGKHYEEIVANATDSEKNGPSTSQSNDLNGTINNSPNPVLTVSKSIRKKNSFL